MNDVVHIYDGHTYTELGRCVDELEVDLFQIPTRSVNHERLAKSNDTLLGTGDGTFEHQKVGFHHTIVGEATHGGNSLLRDVRFRRCVTVVIAPANAIDLLVDLSAVVVAICMGDQQRRDISLRDGYAL